MLVMVHTPTRLFMSLAIVQHRSQDAAKDAAGQDAAAKQERQHAGSWGDGGR